MRVCARARIIALPRCPPARSRMHGRISAWRADYSRIRIAAFNTIAIRLLFGRGRTFTRYQGAGMKEKEETKKTTYKPSFNVNS